MSDPDAVVRVAALAMLLVPERASRLVTLLAPPCGARVAARVAELTTLPRHDRIAALSCALAGTSPYVDHGGATVTESLFLRLRRDAEALAVGPAPGERVHAPPQAHPMDHDACPRRHAA